MADEKTLNQDLLKSTCQMIPRQNGLSDCFPGNPNLGWMRSSGGFQFIWCSCQEKMFKPHLSFQFCSVDKIWSRVDHFGSRVVGSNPGFLVVLESTKLSEVKTRQNISKMTRAGEGVPREINRFIERSKVDKLPDDTLILVCDINDITVNETSIMADMGIRVIHFGIIL